MMIVAGFAQDVSRGIAEEVTCIENLVRRRDAKVWVVLVWS